MLRKRALSKVLVIFSALALLLSTAYAPAYASETTAASEIGVQSLLPITDNNPVTVDIYGGAAAFSITVSDYNVRDIYVFSSTTPVRTELKPVSSSYQLFSGFDSLAPRMGSMIGWHFLPGVEYELLVVPETSPATVTISMSQGDSTSINWLYNQTGATFTEKNMLMGGQTEVYGLANQSQGYYDITVTSNIKNFGVSFSDNDGQSPYNGKAVIMNNNFTDEYWIGDTYTFKNVKLYPTGTSQTTYGITLSNPNGPHAGATYTITVQKVGSF
ncbi:MAG TPA: hypothetical protein GX523_20085 [Desulfitobacterium dehalogenans]|uniref:Uncharacterized protein n=1 Tax=Desulfitobacterium dehalogenans TaxID=36854 RepID=A0A7C6Z7I5_9FIRM|nr:hypothetical protein [Desulfitobacterium dehalogenans]